MQISYKTLGELIAKMSPEQQSDFVTVELPTEGSSECFSAELRIAGENHDGGLHENHPVIFVSYKENERYRDDVNQIASDIGLE